MSITLLTRYGAREVIEDPARFRPEIRQLIDELCEEQFARPDYEHSEVSVTHSSGRYIAATMNGVVVLGHLEPGTEPDRYLYGLSKTELEALFMMLAKGQLDKILELKWADRIAAVRGRGDHYLFQNRPDMTNLHRAASKGDCEWIRSELAAGADLGSTDKHGATPLHWAALAGQYEACRLLLAEGADPSAADQEGETTIEYAELSRETIGPEGAETIVRALRKGREGK